MPNMQNQGYSTSDAAQSPVINQGIQADQVPAPGPTLQQQQQMSPPDQQREEDPQEKSSRDLSKMLLSSNLAEDLDEEHLVEIGKDVCRGYELDCQSKSQWDQDIDEWVKLAAQVRESKTWPWRNASNVKYPLLATAAMQFAARAYPNLIPADGKLVQLKVVGFDPQGQKAQLADKLAKHMNYQIIEVMDDWEEEMDRLLMLLPIVGCVFKKTYFDDIKKHSVSKLLNPKDLVVNYWASSLEDAARKTEVILMNKNQLREMQLYGLYLDVDLPHPTNTKPDKVSVFNNRSPQEDDKSTPYTILEQHTFLDLDDDGYQEPYVITVELETRKVLRIVARWDSDGVVEDADGKVVCIKPVEYYTKYGFIPNPDGSFYDIGFGHLLGPLNESANTIINQLIDAGTLTNLQSGFIGKGLRLRMGDKSLAPGEWRPVAVPGDDIKKQIFPLPIKEPSNVLFQLLGTVIQSGKELASVAEIFTGKMPGQNTPATTTMATIEQGMKVFTAIYKRTYRSLTREFKKLFRLNGIYEENIAQAKIILDVGITRTDYSPKSYDVCPTADPTAVSTTQKMLKAQQLLELLPLGTINVMEVTKRLLEAQEQPMPEALMQQPQQKPDPKVQAAQMKAQQDAEKHKMDMAGKQMDMQAKQLELMFKKQEKEMDMKFKQFETMLEMRLANLQFEQESRHSEQDHMQKMVQTYQKAQVDKEANELRAKSRNDSGVAKSSGNKGNSSGSKRSNRGK